MYTQERNLQSVSNLNKAYVSESHLHIAPTQKTMKSQKYFNKKASKVAPEELPDENFGEDNGSCVEIEESFALKSTKKTISNNHQRIVPFHMPVNQTFKKDKKQINSSELYATPGSILQKKTPLRKVSKSPKIVMSKKPQMLRGPQDSEVFAKINKLSDQQIETKILENKVKVRNYMSQLSQVVIDKKLEAGKFRDSSQSKPIQVSQSKNGQLASYFNNK